MRDSAGLRFAMQISTLEGIGYGEQAIEKYIDEGSLLNRKLNI